MNKLVSINILTYNAEKYIEKCLESVLNQTYKNLEILVTDNASEDKTVEIISKSVRYLQISVELIKNKKNLGYTGGHNVGIGESRGEYVLCLNQDVVLDKDFIKYAVEIMEKDEKIGSVQGKLYKISNFKFQISKILDTTGLLMFKNRRVVSRGQGEKDEGQYDKSEEIFGADGAAPVYRRKALENVKINDQYFDEDFFMYKEDIDLAWRLQLYGWKSFYEPRAIGYHLRTAGERAVKNYISVALARTKISKFAKFHSFKNDRLMRIKNELPSLFFRHILCIIIKEIGAWAYVLIFEHYTWKAIKQLINQLPAAWQKRKIIMSKKRVGAKEMGKWFN